MSVQFKKLRNDSSVAQSVIYKGQQLVLDAYEEKDVDATVAELFLKKCEGIVKEVVEIGAVAEDPEDDVMWIANVTGDPDAAPEVPSKRTDRGHWVNTTIENPVKQPRELVFTMKGGMREVMGKSGVEALNLFPTVTVIPPYQRKRVPQHVGKWILGRVAVGSPGVAIKSRAKSPSEPDMRWELDDMRLYLKLIDPTVGKGQLGPSYRQLTGKAKTEEAKRSIVRAAKETIMKRLHMRCADPKYRLPTPEEFLEFKRGQEEDPVDPEDIKSTEQSVAQ